MKKIIVFCLVALLCIGIMPMSMNAIAAKEKVTIEPEDTLKLTYDDLNKGETINWDWQTSEQLTLDFWIEDPDGDKAVEESNRKSHKGSYIVHTSGTWIIGWENQYPVSSSYTYSIELTYEIEIEKDKPGGLTAKPGDGQVTLSWEGVSGADGYNVYRSTTAGTGFKKINDDPVNDTTYIDNTVTNGIEYYYCVKSVEDGVESEPSNEVNAMPSANDRDGDGVPDTEDAYPDDPTRWVKPSAEKEADTELDLTLLLLILVLVVILALAVLAFIMRRVRKKQQE